MIYGNKITLYILLVLSFFFLTACTNKDNFSYQLYDGYELKSINNEVKLYKNHELFKINDINYNIQEFKYNSDVVCLKIADGNYYMIYYVDGTIYGPYDLPSLEKEINDLSMSFEVDFQDVMKVDGKIYE